MSRYSVASREMHLSVKSSPADIIILGIGTAGLSAQSITSFQTIRIAKGSEWRFTEDMASEPDPPLSTPYLRRRVGKGRVRAR